LICRFAAGEDIWYGAVDGLDDDDAITEESIVAPIEGHPFVDIRPEGSVLKLADVRLLAPVIPTKVVCVGRTTGRTPRRWVVRFPRNPCCSPSRAQR